MRQKITVLKFWDLQFTLVISYRYADRELNLIIDKDRDKDLMQLYAAPLSQYTALCMALCMAAAHEEEKKNKKYLDLTDPDRLFKNITSLIRTHNQIHYGINS